MPMADDDIGNDENDERMTMTWSRCLADVRLDHGIRNKCVIIVSMTVV
jgi:hypothetical protein